MTEFRSTDQLKSLAEEFDEYDGSFNPFDILNDM